MQKADPGSAGSARGLKEKIPSPPSLPRRLPTPLASHSEPICMHIGDHPLLVAHIRLRMIGTRTRNVSFNTHMIIESNESRTVRNKIL